MLRFNPEKMQATRFTLDISGNVQEYALSLLHIINNAREYPHLIYKVENTRSNVVFVTACKNREEDVAEYLENFGTITATEAVRWVRVYVETDYKGYKELYADDIEPDFEIIFE